MVDISNGSNQAECLSTAQKFTTKYEESESSAEFKEDAVKFFADCIVNYFGFKMIPNPTDDDTTNFIAFDENKLPNFVQKESFRPLHSSFNPIAKAIEVFFTKSGSWKNLVNDEFFKYVRPNSEFVVCKNLLYVVAARYAYYTNKLSQLTEYRLTLCKKDSKGRYYLPDSVCYPENAGSLTCTSDADVGLIGKEAGAAVDNYNKAIAKLMCSTGSKKVSCDSETMMDNNMFAYSLELATPEMFVYKDKRQNERHKNMIVALKNMDIMLSIKMLDIAQAALQSIRQGDKPFYNRIKVEVLSGVRQISETADALAAHIASLESEKAGKSHEIYGMFVEEIGKCIYGDQQNYKNALEDIRKALLTASGSYHSFGALRTVVVAMQMEQRQMIDQLSLNDYIASAIENLGYAQGKVMTCSSLPPQCITDASKYVWRTLACLKAAQDIFVELSIVNKDQLAAGKINVERARDFVAELYQVFMKNKRKLPGTYASYVAYNDLSKSRGNSIKKRSKMSKPEDNLREYLGCTTNGECIKNLQKICVEYAVLMVNHEKDQTPATKGAAVPSKGAGINPGGSKGGDGGEICELGARIISKEANKSYFNYVTKDIKKIAKCMEKFEHGGNGLQLRPLCTIM